MSWKIHSGAYAARLVCAAVAAIVSVACGDSSPEIASSGGSLIAPVDPRIADASATGGPNRSPEIQSVRIEPMEPLSGEKAYARVVARDPDGDPVELRYTWKVNGISIRETGEAVVLGKVSRGDKITVDVVASDGRGDSNAMNATARVGNRPPRIVDVAIHTRGNANDEAGEWVVEPTVEDPDGDMIDFTYEWRRGREVLGTGESLSRGGWRRGDEIIVTITANDGDDSSAPLESAPIVIGNAAPDIVSKPPGLDRTGAFRYQVEANDPDGDRGLRFDLGEAPNGMEIDPFGGLVTWKASLEDEGDHKVEIIVGDRQGATAKQTFFLAVKSSRSTSPASIR